MDYKYYCDMKINKEDSVRIGIYDKKDINGYARVSDTKTDGSICIANANMPYMGTFSNVWLSKKKQAKMKITKVIF